MFGCYIKEKTNKQRNGEGCELWEGNERKKWDGEGGCVCVVGEKKKKRQGGYIGGGEKKKEMGSGVYVYGGKKEGVEKKE